VPVLAGGEGYEDSGYVEKPDMRDVVEERDFAVGLDEAAQGADPVMPCRAVEDGVEDEQNSEGGEVVLEGRRVFLQVQEAHGGLRWVGERLPAGGVAVA